jgi:MFS family permease
MPLDASQVFILLCVINLLNYIDRGIIPGAPIQFQGFIQETYGVVPEHVSVYMGLLISSFITSYSIFICIFGYLSISHRPFRLASFGLILWIGAIVLCGLAKSIRSFPLLLFGRLLSGIGESSFHATTPPFIDDFAPPQQRSLWLGIFYAGSAVGTALGFTYGSISATTVGWDVGYYITALLMIPLAYLCHQSIPLQFDRPASLVSTEAGKQSAELTLSPVTELFAILQSPLFLTSSLGLGAYCFSIAGLSAFAPALVIGYGILDEHYAATVFGVVVIVSGLIGYPLGGCLVDRAAVVDDDCLRLMVATRYMFLLMTAGVFWLLISIFCMQSAIIFFLILATGLILVFATQAASSIVVLLSVSKARRGFATGLNSLILHAFGDVPSPILLGLLKDYLAPHCGSVTINGNTKMDPLCIRDKEGLRLTLAMTFIWMLWTVVLWGLTYILARRQWTSLRKEEFSPIKDPEGETAPMLTSE